MSTAEDSEAAASTYLDALKRDDMSTAFALLSASPELATSNVFTAASVADAESVAAFLAADPGCATRATANGPEPLIYACHGGIADRLGVAADQRVRTVQLLLDAGASPNASIQPGDDPSARIPALYFACVSNNVRVAQLLLQRGAEPDDGESVFHAAEMNHRDCLALLVAHGADISSPHGYWGNTPLYFLANIRPTHHNATTALLGAQWLLEHGADPNVESVPAPLKGVAGRTAYTQAMRCGHSAFATLLAAHGADRTRMTPVDRLLAACATADGATARAIVAEHPPVLSMLTADDRLAISNAIADGRTESVDLMLSLGWSLTEQSSWGGTPLHVAAWFGRPDIVRLLLDRGAPVNVRDTQYGSSPIAWASHGSRHARPGYDDDYVAVTGLLLDAGSTRAESFNAWHEAPENIASDAVAALLRTRGFTTLPT